jgi:hypothetical protein
MRRFARQWSLRKRRRGHGEGGRGGGVSRSGARDCRAGIAGMGSIRNHAPHGPPKADTTYVAQAQLLERMGAAMLDFTHSGPEAGRQSLRRSRFR